MGGAGIQKIIRVLTAQQAQHADISGAVKFYAGKDYQTFRSLAPVQPLSGFFSAVQARVYDFLVEIDGVLQDVYADTASHNIYLSPLPGRALRVAAMVVAARQYPDSLYIVDTKTEVYLYSRVLRAEGFICPDGRYFYALPDLLRGLRDGVKFFVCALKKLARRVPVHKSGRHKFWFVSWLNNNSLSSDDLMQRNRYYGDMAAVCARRHDTGIIGRAIRGVDAPEAIVMMQDYRRLADLVHGLLRGLSFTRRIFWTYKALVCDMTPLVRHSLAMDILSGRYIETYLDYRAACRFAEDLPDDARIIYPFENQPWEKAMLKAFAEAGKDLKVYGYQFFPLPPALLMDRFSAYQRQCCALPIALMTSDKSSKELLSASAMKTLPAGSQRYKSDLDREPSFSEGFSSHIVLCSLFLDENEAVELAMKSMLATAALHVRLWINMHPMISVHVHEKICTMACAYDHVEIRDEAFSVLVPQAGVVLYNSSSVVYDAVFQGIPAIYVESDLMPDMNRFYGPVKSFSDPETGRDILRWLLSEKGAYADYARKLHQAAVENIQIVDNNVWELL